MTAITAVFCGVLGLLIGSFLNVVDLAGAARRVDRPPAVALPGLRHADRAARQHPGHLLAAARGKCRACGARDLGALPASSC